MTLIYNYLNHRNDLNLYLTIHSSISPQNSGLHLANACKTSQDFMHIIPYTHITELNNGTENNPQITRSSQQIYDRLGLYQEHARDFHEKGFINKQIMILV